MTYAMCICLHLVEQEDSEEKLLQLKALKKQGSSTAELALCYHIY